MSANKLRWGILSTAQIARKNWKAILNTGNGTVVAVASRDGKRAQQFIADCQADAPMDAVPRALGSYEELLAASDVDAVYIPLPTGLRKEWVLRAAAAGKHIVCEKPCADSVADLIEMTDACRANHVQFMDGVMFMHSMRLQRMRAVLDDGMVTNGSKLVMSHARRLVVQAEHAAGNQAVAARYLGRDALFRVPLPGPDQPLADATLPTESDALLRDFVVPFVRALGNQMAEQRATDTLAPEAKGPWRKRG